MIFFLKHDYLNTCRRFFSPKTYTQAAALRPDFYDMFFFAFLKLLIIGHQLRKKCMTLTVTLTVYLTQQQVMVRIYSTNA